MFPNPYPELSADRQRHPVPLPDDGAPPAGRPVTIYDEDNLDPAVRARGAYDAAQRSARQLPWAILRFGLPNVLIGLVLLDAGRTFAGSGLGDTGGLSFALAMIGLVVLVPGLLMVGLALASRKRSRFAFRVLIGLYVLPFVAGPAAALIGPGLVEGAGASGTSLFYDPRLYLLFLLGSFALSLPLTLWGVMYLIRADRALRTIEGYEAQHPET
jgi:hypothetical protein